MDGSGRQVGMVQSSSGGDGEGECFVSLLVDCIWYSRYGTSVLRTLTYYLKATDISSKDQSLKPIHRDHDHILK